MNKKLFSAVLMGALLFGGTFVSCKDYDDDIENLQNQINKLASSSELSSQVSTLQSAISAAQGAAEAKAAAAQTVADAAKGAANDAASAAKAAQEAADKVAADLDAANKDLAGKIEAAQAAADKASQNLEAALDAAKGEITKTVEAAQAAADKAAADLAALQASVEANTAAIEAAAKAAKAAQAAADSKATPEDVAKAAQKAADDLKAAKEELEGKLSALEAELNKVKESLKSTTTSESLEAANEAIKKIEESLKELTNVTGKRLTSLVFAPTTYVNGIEAIQFTNLVYTDWGTDSKLWLKDNPTKWYLEPGQAYKDYKVRQVADFGAQVEYLVSPAGVKIDGIKDLSFRWNRATNTTKADYLELSVVDKKIEDGKLILDVKKNDYNTSDYQSTIGLSYFIEHVFDTLHIANSVDFNYIDTLLYYRAYLRKYNEDFNIVALEATLADEVKTEEEKGQEISVFSDWARVRESEDVPQIHNSLVRTWYGTIDCNQYNSHFWKYSNIYDKNLSTNGKEGPADGIFSANTNCIAKRQVYTDSLNLLSLVTVCTADGDAEIKNYKKYGLDFEFHLMKYVVKNNENAGEGYWSQDNTNQLDFASLDDTGTILIATAENHTPLNANAIGRTPVIQVVLKDVNANAVVDVKYFKIQWVAEAPATIMYPNAYDMVMGFECTDNNEKYKATYSGWIYETWMNNFYTDVIEGGIGKAQFRTRYPNLSRIYSGVLSKELIESIGTGAADLLSIGYAQWQNDEWSDTQTQNVSLKFYNYYVNPRVDTGWDGNVYDATSKVLAPADYDQDGFFWFESQDGTSRVYVPVKLHVKKSTMYSQYLQNQWNTEAGAIYTAQPKASETKKYRNLNPSLSSDPDYGATSYKSTQLRGDITYGYIYAGEAPANTASLVKSIYADGTQQAVAQAAQAKASGVNVRDLDNFATSNIDFDATRFNELPKSPEAAGTKDSNGKKYSSYEWFAIGDCLYHGVPNRDDAGNIINAGSSTMGARIDGNNIYLVDNNGNTTAGKKVDYSDPSTYPTRAALLLVGQKIPVVVYAWDCEEEYKEVADQYYFNFINPLKFENTGDPITLIDVKTEGSKAEIDINKYLKLTENFGQNTSRIWLYIPETFTEKQIADNNAIAEWYGVEVIGVNNAGVKTTMNKNGGVDSDYNTLLSDIKDANGNPLYSVILDNLVDGPEDTTQDPIDSTYTIKYDETITANYKYYADSASAAAAGLVAVLDKNGNQVEMDSLDINGGIYGAQKTDTVKVSVKVAGVETTYYALNASNDTILVPVWTNKKTEGKAYSYDTYTLLTTDGKKAVKMLNTDGTPNTEYKPKDIRPAFKHSDGKYYTLANGGIEVVLLQDSAKHAYYVNASEKVQVNPISGKTGLYKDAEGNIAADSSRVDKIIEAAGTEPMKAVVGNDTTEIVAKIALKVRYDTYGNVVMDINGNTVYDPEEAYFCTPHMIDMVAPEVIPTKLKAWGEKVYKYPTIPLETTDGSGTVYFHNMQSNAIAKGDKIDVRIPVQVKTKWEQLLEGYIYVTVKSGL